VLFLTLIQIKDTA